MGAGSGRVLVVDDEALVAFDLADIVERTGREVIGPAVSIAQAHRVTEAAVPDVALLDIDVRGELVWELARNLRQKGCIPIFVSANPRPRDLPEFGDCIFLSKPAGGDEVRAALDRAFAERGAG